jgi:hypothetical protein
MNEFADEDFDNEDFDNEYEPRKRPIVVMEFSVAMLHDLFEFPEGAEILEIYHEPNSGVFQMKVTSSAYDDLDEGDPIDPRKVEPGVLGR